MSPNKIGRQIEKQQQESLAPTPSRYSVPEVVETNDIEDKLDEGKKTDENNDIEDGEIHVEEHVEKETGNLVKHDDTVTRIPLLGHQRLLINS